VIVRGMLSIRNEGRKTPRTEPAHHGRFCKRGHFSCCEPTKLRPEAECLQNGILSNLPWYPSGNSPKPDFARV